MSTPSNPTTLNPLAEPFQSKNTRAGAPPTPDPANDLIFHNFATYPFDQDAEFQSGLSAILGHPVTPASAEEAQKNADLVLKAQCFFFARKNNLASPIDPESYKSWLRSRDPRANTSSVTDDSISQELPTDPAGPSRSEPPPPPPPSISTTPLPSDPPPPTPPYPISFNYIVDLITRNQPIPGIENIPNIVLGTENAAPNTVPARRKPWETPKDKDSPQEQSHTSPTNDSSTGGAEALASTEKPLYGGLLGPLKRTGESGDVKPIPVQTRTPSWQELAEEGPAGKAAPEGDAPVGDTPAAHAA